MHRARRQATSDMQATNTLITGSGIEPGDDRALCELSYEAVVHNLTGSRNFMMFCFQKSMGHKYPLTVSALSPVF